MYGHMGGHGFHGHGPGRPGMGFPGGHGMPPPPMGGFFGRGFGRGWRRPYRPGGCGCMGCLTMLVIPALLIGFVLSLLFLF